MLKMRKRNLISFFVILLAAMSLCGCESVEGKGAAPELYGTDSEAYFTASYYLSQPSIEKADFRFPLVSKREIKEVKDFGFYQNGLQTPVKSENSELVLWEAHYNGSEGEVVPTQDFRYVVRLELSVYDMRKNNPILIDEVRLTANGYAVSFKVDIEIRYEYTDYNEVPDIMICSPFNNQDYDTVEGGIVVIDTLFRSRRNAVINKVVFRSMEAEWDAIRIRKRDFFEGWGEYVPFEEGFEIEKTEYEIQIEIANSKITAFVDEAIDLYVTVNGLYDTVWRSDLDRFNSFLPSNMLSDANRMFF